jgi:hypothetical protein
MSTVTHLSGVRGRFSRLSAFWERRPRVRIRNEQDAIAAYAAFWGSIPEGNHVSATWLELATFGGDTDECLWRVGLVPDDEKRHWLDGPKRSNDPWPGR